MTLGDLLATEPKMVPLLVLGSGILAFFALMTGAWNPLASSARTIGRATWPVTPAIFLLSAILTLALIPITTRSAVLSTLNIACCVLALLFNPSNKTGAIEETSAGRRAAESTDRYLARRATLVAVGGVLQAVAIGLPANFQF